VYLDLKVLKVLKGRPVVRVLKVLKELVLVQGLKVLRGLKVHKVLWVLKVVLQVLKELKVQLHLIVE
jgi:hypothetical protein